uniref:CSON014850 protein n=1 Tax=Culicoides sonorensis TaxID=179676 RepID=A0A336KSV8_CULSO
MYTIGTFDYDCTKKCKKTEHGNAITSALTKRAVSNEKLARYITKMCRNFAEVLDDEGRSALHMAVSVGNRYDIVEYLIRQGAVINLRDRESGQTAITRAILYGNLAEAIFLSKNGANLLPDNDFINPLQYCYRVKKPIDNENRCETFVWGRNKNYNIGIGNSQEKTTPDYLDEFRKNKIYIQKVSMNSYHSLFLTDDSELYVTGHGKGGRLGSGDEMTIISPKKVRIPFRDDDEKIISISAGKNHSLVLTNKNRVYVTGSNTFGQLGLKSNPDMLMSFTEVPVNISDAKRVIANDFTSMIVTDNEIYMFGTNLGQFGLKREVDKVITPRKLINFNVDLEIVESTNAALICYSSTSTLLQYFYKYETKTYKKPLMERITQISATGGIIQENHKNCPRSDRPLRFIVLTEFHNVFIWYENTEKFVKCTFTSSRFLEIDRLIWCNEDILLSFMGNLYRGTATHELKHRAIHIPGEYQETYVKKELSTDQKTKIELKRIPLIDKIIDFCTDPEGENFIGLVENPKKYFSLPEFIEKTYDYTNLFSSVNVYDTIHDVCFELGGRHFPAHRIIIQHRSEYLKKIINDQFPNEKLVKLQELSDLGLPCDIFELILRYIYTNQPIMKNEIERLTENYHQTLTMLKKILTVMGLTELINSLKKNSQKIKSPFTPLNREDFPDLYDVTLKLDCTQEIRAHKCILMSRLEYFNMMFDHSWAEQDTVNLQSIAIEYMQPIIDFLYKNDINDVREAKYSDNYLYNMITICDQFFVEDLKNIFELIASEKISVKNCGEILEFADAYNCEILRNCCMQYISLNFSRILELRSLEQTDPKVLQQLNKFYRQFYSLVSYWTITPYANAVSDDDLESFISDFMVDLNANRNPDEENLTFKQKQKNKTGKLSKTTLDKRNYEKTGIIAMLEESNQDHIKAQKCLEMKKQELQEEINQVTVKFESEAKIWTKVSEKSGAKKKQNNVLAALKVNDVMQNESKSGNSFINLTPPKKLDSPSSSRGTTMERTPEPSTSKNLTSLLTKDSEEESPRNKLTFSLADITPIKMKPGKNRKRLSSGSTQSVSIPENGSSSHHPIVSPSNPWKIVPLTDVIKSPIDLEQESIMNASTSMKKSQNRKSSEINSVQGPSQPKSFDSIMQNEREKKQYFEKIKTKSLVLTQLEEKAIEELKEFYNVDNIFDETITIERRRMTCEEQNQVNVAKWYQDKKLI